MERFSNDTSELLQQVIRELTFEESSSQSVQYLEVSHVLTHGFSFQITLNENPVLLQKVWDAQYDHSRFQSGIYNLDRLAISTTRLPLSNKALSLLNNIDWNKIGPVSYTHLTLPTKRIV